MEIEKHIIEDKNMYLWIPYGKFELCDAIWITRHELEILKSLVKKKELFLNINLN